MLRTSCLRLMLLAAILQLLLLARPSQGFSGIVSAGGKASVRFQRLCEGEGGVCFTQGACCEDFSCERTTSTSPQGRCTSRRASMRLAGDDEAGTCQTDADCPAAACCAATKNGKRRCRECAVDNGDSMESLFDRYYSAMMRKRFH